MKIDLTGKKILVTGGGRGIGAAITQELIEAGADVAVHYHSSVTAAGKLASQGSGSFPVQADLNQPEELRKMFKKTISAMGRLDVLINNAGTAIHSPPDEDDQSWLENWDKTLNINLKASAFLCKLALPGFIDGHGGIIINISSRAAHRGDTKEYLAYAASKGGMEALTKSLAREYGKQGVLVYGIAPGFTRTDMAREFINTYGEQHALKDIALNELTTPEDISPLVVFLASGKARHATGTTIDVNAASYVR